MKRFSTPFIVGTALGLAIGTAGVALAAWQPIPGGSSYLRPGRTVEIICATNTGTPLLNTPMRVIGPAVGGIPNRYSVFIICPP